MTDKKFTDEEVIKALELCSKSLSIKTCQKCPFYLRTNCVSALKLNAIDLINRQKAEIEQWQEEANKWQIFFSQEIDNRGKIKAEAYKEFAEKLKEKNFNFCIDDIYDGSGEVKVIEINQSRFNKQIAYLLKEMVGEEE